MIKNKIGIIPGFSRFGKNMGIGDNTLDFGGILSDTICNTARVICRLI